MSISISVVVPTFRRPALLERCLQALVAQDLDPTAYEIIIVDDAASKETRLQVEQYARHVAPQGYHLYYLPTRGRCGPAAARNLGWRAARSEIIAFTDDDCIPAANWLREGRAAFVGDIVAVSGRIRVPLPPDPSDYAYDASHLEQSEFATANCFYLRTVLAAVGGFDERFRAAWREDSDLFFTVLEHQAHYRICQSAVVVHPVRPACWGISLFQQRKSMFNALLYKKHRHLYRKRIQATLPWLYYCSTAALLIVILSLLVHAWVLALAASGLWALLTARFCQKRLQHTSHRPNHVWEMMVTSALIPPLALFWRLRGMLAFQIFFL